MGVHGRDLGHVADDVTRGGRSLRQGRQRPGGVWIALRPDRRPTRSSLAGSKIVLSGEYSRMQDTFRNLGIGLVLASLLIYFLMVALFKSWLTPLVILSAVPVGLVGVVIDALPDGDGDQRAVAAGRDLHGRHRGVQHGAA